MKSTILTLLAISFYSLTLLVHCNRMEACSRLGPVVVSQTCRIAEYIVRATAVEYSKYPEKANLRTAGIPTSKVAFRVEEVLKGDSLSGRLELNGYLSDNDEFNDQPVPYNFVRRSGRAGSCFANTYKKGAQFLLFLKRSDHLKRSGITAEFRVDIDALAPVNEQLHSSDDPWVFYIKGLIEGLREIGASEKTKK